MSGNLKLSLLSLIIFPSVLSLVFFLNYLRISNEIKSLQANSTQITPTPTPPLKVPDVVSTDTSDWLTYSDTGTTLKFSYPPNGKVTTANQYLLINTENPKTTIRIDRKKLGNTTLEDTIRKSPPKTGNIDTVKAVTIGEFTGYTFYDKDPKSKWYLLISDEKKYLEVFTTDAKPETEDYNQLSKTILSTFKFLSPTPTDSTSDWETYKNSDISFKYPPLWQISNNNKTMTSSSPKISLQIVDKNGTLMNECMNLDDTQTKGNLTIKYFSRVKVEGGMCSFPTDPNEKEVWVTPSSTAYSPGISLKYTSDDSEQVITLLNLLLETFKFL